jgi:hypothetical protein
MIARPCSFYGSPAAAAVVLNRNCNVVSEWKVKSERLSYDDVKLSRFTPAGEGE